MTVCCFNKEKISRLKRVVETTNCSNEVKLHKALANEKRQIVLHILQEEPCCVCDLAHILNCPVPNISQYLKILGEVKLVCSEQKGKFIIYNITEKAKDILSNTPKWM